MLLQMDEVLDGAGARRWLLESACLWSLEDLQNISRGSSSELLAWLTTSSNMIASLARCSLLSSVIGDE